MALIFNLLMTLADGGLLLALGRGTVRRSLLVVLAWGAFGGALAAELPAAFAVGPFAVLRLAAWGVFVHLPLVLFATAGMLRRVPRIGIPTAAAGLALVLIAADAFWLEPTWLEVSHHTVASSKVRRPRRLVVLADFQTDVFGDYEREVFRRALAAGPDLILLPGDYIQERDRSRRDRLTSEINAYLRALGFGARDGVLAVRGDIDGRDWERLFTGLPVRTFERTRTFDVAGLTVTALSRRDSRDPALQVPPSRRFHVVFGHGPEFALNGLDADLLLAGHTHGGQVRLPWIGPLMTLSRVPRAWAAGRTDLAGGKTLIVSRGVGMERDQAPRLRFLCRPEIVVVDLKPAAGAAG